MKKIVIVNNNMEIGGVQKSLCNLLWEIHERYEVTLCLFGANGAYMDQIPADVKIVVCSGFFRYLGASQKQFSGTHSLIRGTMALTARLFGRNFVMPLMQLGEKNLPEQYDCAIAFLQNGNIRNYYGGTQEYVLHKIRADRKVAFLHCDYGSCGANHPVNNRLIAKFDQVAACSDGCRVAFENIMPELAEKSITVRNCHRYEEILQLAEKDSVEYPSDSLNVVMVSRLSHEKGIERAIESIAYAHTRAVPVMLHIVGGGSMQVELEELAVRKGLAEHVRFYGEQVNPYRYMKNADLFLMASYHEAAPMVIDEVVCLGVPVLSTRTTSSEEMITRRNCGWVCENTQEALSKALFEALRDDKRLRNMKEQIKTCPVRNTEAIAQFEKLIEE